MSNTVVYHQTNAAEDTHHEVSPTLLALFRSIASPGHYAIDVGCGQGRFTFEIAPKLAYTIGIDLDMEGIEAAQTLAQEKGIDTVSFFVADAEQVDYTEFITFETYDLVTAHLCLSKAIIGRAASALRPGGRFLFAALEAGQWGETGVQSSFAFSEEGLRKALASAGLRVEYLGVETEILEYETASSLESAWLNGVSPKWLNGSRRAGLAEHVKAGGNTLTVRSHLIGRAVKAAR
ncbi:MAG: methyltransferase domain-containing protein [Planctomycetota bacterium]|nr:methyltransferase domain-containing protein [Planctomycetota bacterium]MDA1138184.1 methyltransferase domain-containing protein [Planctomycetota bacterium]